MTFLCVAVPTLNRAHFVDRFLTEIRDVIPQIKADVEILILDSASTDKTAEIVAKHKPQMPQLKYRCQRTTQPNWESHFLCPHLTNADFIMWCGDDDLPVAEGVNYSLDLFAANEDVVGSFYGVHEKGDDGKNDIPVAGDIVARFDKGDFQRAVNFFFSTMHHVELGIFKTSALRNVSAPRKIFLGYWLFASLLKQGAVNVHSVPGVVHRLRSPGAKDANHQWGAAVDKLDQLRAGYEYLIWRAMLQNDATQLSPETKTALSNALTQRFAMYAQIAQRVAHDAGDKQAALEFAMRAALWTGDASQVAEFEQATSETRVWNYAGKMAAAGCGDDALSIDIPATTQALRVM